MTPNAYLWWFALIALAGCILGCRSAARRVGRWLDGHRWEASTEGLTVTERAVIAEAEAIIRAAERAERRRT